MRTVSAVALFAAVLATGGCELALYGHQQATDRGCEAWRPGCPIDVDVAGGDPIQRTRVADDRPAIVDMAASAPYRRCTVPPLGCQARIIGDVMLDRYFLVF